MSPLMKRLITLAAVGVGFIASANAQFNSPVVGFNGPPIDDPATSSEMFRNPEFTGSTEQFIVPNSAGAFDNNAAFRASGLQSEGAAALQTFFNWIDPNDPAAWVRLTTFNGTEIPNPGLHTQGEVRFKLTNSSEFFLGDIGLVIGIRETGVVVPQLGNGGTTGDIEWIGVDTTINGIIAGADGIVDTAATGDDIQAVALGTDLEAAELPLAIAIIEPGPNGVIDTTPAGDDETRFGYTVAPDGVRTPIPAATITPTGLPVSIRFDLDTGNIFVNGANRGGGIAPFTGNGILDAPNNRGTLEHVGLVNVPDDDAVFIDVAIDELQFEAPVPEPVLPPTVVAPIILDDTQVTVTNLLVSVNQVTLYRDGSPILTENVTDDSDVVFTLPAPALTGEIYAATQRDGATGTVSDLSPGVEVLPEASPYTLSFVIDENGDGSCSFEEGGWEYVGVTGLTGGLPDATTAIFNDPAVWQAYDIPLTDDSQILAWLGGNGVLDPSPTGLWSIDSLWLTLSAGGEVGPYEFFLDSVEVLDEFGNVIDVIHHFEDGVRYMANARGQSTTQPTVSNLSSLASNDGTTSHLIEWEYPSTSNEALILFHNIGFGCGTGPTFLDSGATIRFHVHARTPDTGNVPLPTVESLVVGEQTAVRVTVDPDAASVQLYINGEPVGDPVLPTGTTVDFTGLTLFVGDSVSAKQTTTAGESGFAYPRAAYLPVPPVIIPPVQPGDDEIQVGALDNSLFASASEVAILVDGIEVATATPTGNLATVTLPAPLAGGEIVTATQTVNNIESLESDPIIVATPTPVIFAAPAEGDASIRVLGLVAGADATILLNGSPAGSATVPTGQSAVDVPVTGLIAGDIVTAFQSVGPSDSAESTPETVTVAGSSVVLCDDFEVTAATYQANWADSADPRLLLSTDENATTVGEGGGSQSLLNEGNIGRVQQAFTKFTPTPTEPMVWNVDIFDTAGPGATGANQFAQIIELDDDFFLLHVGISNLASDVNFYQFRAIGNGGPNWIDLNAFDGPERSVGWHNFTVVHKGTAIDVYVDGLLAAKNVPVDIGESTLGLARIGPGIANDIAGYYDDYCIERGAVRFGAVPAAPPAAPAIQSPIVDSDLAVTVTGVSDTTDTLEIRDESDAVLGTATGPFDPEIPVEIALSRGLVHLEALRAAATNTNGTTLSSPLEVGIGNGPLLFSLGIRETGDAGAVGSPGGTSGTIEFLGATAIVDGAPQGKPIAPANTWQTLSFDPTSDPVETFNGDGTLAGTGGVLEHLAIAVDAAASDRSTGPYLLYIDNVRNAGTTITDLESATVGSQWLFNQPGFSGSTDGDLAGNPDSAVVSPAFGNPGQSIAVEWFYVDTTAQRWIRLTTFNAANVPNPVVDLTQPIELDVLLLPACSTVPGDVDGDGDLDAADALALIDCVTGPGNPITPACLCADLDGDLDVDLDDVSIMQALLD